MFDDTSQTTNYGSQWQCVACDSPHTELDLPSLQKHFASQHNVLNLLSSPATQAVVPPSRLSSCHADSCDQSQTLFSCIFCGGMGLQEKDVREHLGRIHGGFFQRCWKSYTTSHCSCFAAVQWGWGPVLSPAGDSLKAVKKEEDIVADGGTVAVGRNNNIFAFEELKRTSHRNRKFSTNKIKQEIELENLKAEKEEQTMQEGRLERKDIEGLEESKLLKEVLGEGELLRKELPMNEEVGGCQILKDELGVPNIEATVDDQQAIQSSLDKLLKEKSEIEGELVNLKNINLKREELKKEKSELGDLRSEVEKAKKGEVSRKIKLAAVVVEALIDPTEKMRKYNLDAEVEKMSSDVKGDVVEVVLKGTPLAVEKTDNLLREMSSSYLLMPLKDSERSVLTAGEGLLLAQIRRMAEAAIGYKDGMLYIFGTTERERSEAKAVIKKELRLCTSSSWRRWGFLRKSSNVGWR